MANLSSTLSIIYTASTNITIVLKLSSTQLNNTTIKINNTTYNDGFQDWDNSGQSGDTVLSITLLTGDTLLASSTGTVSYLLFQSDGVTSIALPSIDSTIPTVFALLDKRSKRIDLALAYLVKITTNAQAKAILDQLTYHIANYRWKDDTILSWVKGESSVWGNFTSNGFPSTTYFTTQRQTDLINILS